MIGFEGVEAEVPHHRELHPHRGEGEDTRQS